MTYRFLTWDKSKFIQGFTSECISCVRLKPPICIKPNALGIKTRNVEMFL